MDFSFRAAEKGELLLRTWRHVQEALTTGCPHRGGIVDGGGGGKIGSDLQLVLGWAHLINGGGDCGVITWLSSLVISVAPRILSLSKSSHFVRTL